MSWELRPAREAFPEFAAEWDRLNKTLYASHPMFDSRFIGPLLEHFGSGDEILCLHRSGASIDGALIVRPLGKGRWALFMPAQTQAGALMIENARVLDTLPRALPGYAWSLDLLSVDPLYAPSWAGLDLPQIVTPHALTMAVSLDGDFAGYWQTRPKNLIKNIRRYQKRAEDSAGKFSLVHITDPTEIAKALVRYGELESAGWKGKEGTAIAADNAQGRFYLDMLLRFAGSGQGFVMELHTGERLIASRLFIGHERMWIILKTTYDETQSIYAPGRLLLHDVLKEAFATMPGGAVEFYTNASRDQAEWATSLRPIPHRQIVRNDLFAALLVVVKSFREKTCKDTADSASFDPLQVQSFRSVCALPADAIRLMEAAERDYPEFAPGWFANLESTVFADDPGVRYYVASLDGKTRAILPVRLVQAGRVRRVEALGNYYTSLYAPLLAHGATELDLIPLIKAASRDHNTAQEMRFAPMDPAAPAYAATLAALRSCGWIPFRYFCFGNWHLDVDQDWPTYLGSRQGKLRSTIKRKGRKFAAAGGTLEIIVGRDRLEQAIDNFNLVYSRSWKKPEPYARFIPGLVRWLAAQGWLRLGIARLDGKPIAAEIWIVANGKANIFKLAHDQHYSVFAPGTLLTAHLMRHVIDHDHVREVDYLVGDDSYKADWMGHRRERWGIVAYNQHSKLGLLLSLREMLGHILGKYFHRTI